MKNLAIITARSGSKGLRDKNIKLLNGLPLIYYSITAAKDSGMFEEIMVSTDSEKYADIARKFGASVPFLRSAENSGDKASSWDVIVEVLKNYRNKGIEFETVCLLQPTSPLRIADDIERGYSLLKGSVDSVTAVCEVDHSPLWCMTLEDDVSLDSFRKTLVDVPRQALRQYYRINGALYIRKVEYNGDEIMILNNREKAYIMPRERSIDIDTELDFVIAECVMNFKQSDYTRR